MTEWERSGLTCLLQISAVAACSLGLLGGIRARRHLHRLRLCEVAVIGLGLLSLLAVVRPLLGASPLWSPAVQVPALPVAGGAPAAAAAPGAGGASVGAHALEFSWRRLQSVRARLWKLVGACQVPLWWPRWRLWLLVPLTCAVAGAVLRLCLALWWLILLWRTTRTVADDRFAAELDRLRQVDGIRCTVMLRESAQICQPVVLGWWQPTILVPPGWQDWSLAERRLVLAHELAHVRQGDIVWRLLAEVVLALHVYHPLVHALHCRLILEQELAADRTAAGQCGGPAAYLRTLACLALRDEIRPERVTLAPVLTGLLMRRIEMLQTRDGHITSSPGWKTWLAPAALGGMIGLVGWWHLPAGAEVPEPPLQTQAATVPVATVDGRPQAEPPGVFSRREGGPLLIPHATGGLLEWHLHDAIQGMAPQARTAEVRREIADALRGGLEEMLDESGQELLGMLHKALLRDEVQAVSADLRVNLAYRPAQPAGSRHQLTFSCTSVGVHLRNAQDWRQGWQGSSGDLASFRGIPYRTLPVLIPFTAPELPPHAGTHPPAAASSGKPPAVRPPLRMCAAYPDPRTLVLVFGEQELTHVFPESPAVFSEHLTRLRKSVAGGLLTFVVPASALTLHGLAESADPPEAALARLLGGVEALAIGIDIGEDQRLAIRLRCGCKHVHQARAAEQTLKSLLQSVDALIRERALVKVSGGEQQPVDGGRAFYRELIRHAQVTVDVQPNGSADLVFQSSASHWTEIQ